MGKILIGFITGALAIIFKEPLKNTGKKVIEELDKYFEIDEE